MPVRIVPALADLFPSSITAHTVSNDIRGDHTVLSSTAYDCYYSGKEEIVRDEELGREVKSSYHAIVDITTNLTTRGHRYTLDGSFDPYIEIAAISCKHVFDENGLHHVVVFFP